MAADTGTCGPEWFCAGIKGTSGNASDMMSEIVLAYCSDALSVSSGGPGASVKLGFYEGYTIGGTTPTTAIAVFTLSGLPAATACGSFVSCYILQVTFDPLVCFADGAIGYSWGFRNTGPSYFPSLGTFPALACVQSCSGPGPDGPRRRSGGSHRARSRCRKRSRTPFHATGQDPDRSGRGSRNSSGRSLFPHGFPILLARCASSGPQSSGGRAPARSLLP